MSAAAVARSGAVTALLRYRRSWGLWLLLLIGPIGARFLIGREDGGAVDIAIDGHLPVLTSAVFGVSLGIIVSTLLLPAAFIYLRASVTRRQPWQIEDVAPASRVALSLGRFAADAAVLLVTLLGLTAGGIILAWLTLGLRQTNLAQLVFALWIVAAPALIGIAALRQLFDALPALRGGLGDFVYLWLWLASIAVPAALHDSAPGFAANLVDFAGFTRPMMFGAPPGSDSFAIGGFDVKPGRIPLDVMAGLLSPGYVASRLAWVGIAIAIAAFAGLVYRPRRPARQRALRRLLARLDAAPPPPPARRDAPPAARAALPLAGLLRAEFSLIGGGRAALLLAALAAAAGLAADYRHIGSGAANLWLIFALTAHGGAVEARGLRALAGTMAQPPMLRRAASIAAALGWALLLALPGALWHAEPARLLLALATGGVVAGVAVALTALTASSFAPRLLLLIAWYGYLAS